MKALSVQLVVRAMIADGAPDWAIDAAGERLHQCAFWHDYLTVVRYAPGPRVLWSATEPQKRSLQSHLQHHGREYWTVPVADILAEDLLEQLAKFRKAPANFNNVYPAPREVTVGKS